MLSNLSRIKLTKSRLLNLQRFILVQLCSFALLGICLLDIVLRVLENNAVFTICVTCFFASVSKHILNSFSPLGDRLLKSNYPFPSF